MQSGLDKTWPFLPLLGRAASACALLGCSVAVPAHVPAEPQSEQPGTMIAVGEQGAQPAAPAASQQAAHPIAPATLIAGPVRTLTIAPLVVHRSTPVVPEASVKTFNISLQCGGAVPCPAGSGFGWVQLDEHAPRPFVLSRPLASLLNEDEEIAPGEHSLLAAVVTPEKIYADAVSFRVEPARRSQVPSRSGRPAALGSAQPESAEQLPAPALCFLVLPAPTVNGQGEQALELLAVLLDVHGIDHTAKSPVEQGNHEVVIHYAATNDAGVARGSFPLGTSALLERPAAGDLRINVSCERDGKEWAKSERTVTLNPELAGAKK